LPLGKAIRVTRPQEAAVGAVQVMPLALSFEIAADKSAVMK
jgi:hypothetical protein